MHPRQLLRQLRPSRLALRRPSALLPKPHPWWEHLSPERQTPELRRRMLWLRLRGWLGYRRHRIELALASYLLLCVVPLLMGMPLLSAYALLPVLLVPPVAFLIYWLVWLDFHQ